MSDVYKLSVNDAFDFEVSAEHLSDIDILQISDNEYHILQDYSSYEAKIESSDFNAKSYTVKLNNRIYDIKISDDLDLLIKDMGFALGSTKQVNIIKAPMPGLILDMAIKAGQNVSENDTLLILEAMKMENIIASPRDGTIKSISVKKGDAVEKNQLLIEFE